MQRLNSKTPAIIQSNEHKDNHPIKINYRVKAIKKIITLNTSSESWHFRPPKAHPRPSMAHRPTKHLLVEHKRRPQVIKEIIHKVVVTHANPTPSPSPVQWTKEVNTDSEPEGKWFQAKPKQTGIKAQHKPRHCQQ